MHAAMNRAKKKTIMHVVIEKMTKRYMKQAQQGFAVTS